MSSEIFSVFPLPISRELSLHYVVSFSASFDVIPLFLHRSLLLYFGLRESTSSLNNLAEMSRPFDKIEFSCYLQYIAILFVLLSIYLGGHLSYNRCARLARQGTESKDLCPL